MESKLCIKNIRDKIADKSCNIIIFNSIDSTNTYGKSYILEGSPLPAMIISEEQTAGRGRLGRNFYSPHGSGLYASILCATELLPEDATFATVAASVASALTIEMLSGRSAQIKWVNDIYLDGKKAGGILCESIFTNEKMHLIVGIGINVTTKDFPTFEGNTPTSTGRLDRAALAAKIYDLFNYYFAVENHAECIAEYRKRFYLQDKRITVCGADGSNKLAIARGIDDRGGLIVEYENGKIEIIRTGEVTVREK